MSVKLLTEHHLEFLTLKGGHTGSSESTLVKMPHYWKSHVTTHLPEGDNTLQEEECPWICNISLWTWGIIMNLLHEHRFR